MKLLYAVLIFIGFFSLDNAISVATVQQIASNQLSTQQLMTSRANNPEYTLPCFDLFIQQYNATLQVFESSYQKCETKAEAQYSELNTEAAGNRTLISTTAQSVCSSMNDCSALNASLKFLDCYSDVGDTNLKTIYILTSNASVVAANLREQIRIVEVNQQVCQNASERAFTESNAAITQSLSYCLENGPPAIVTTTAPLTISLVVNTLTTETTEETTIEPSATAAIQVEDISAPEGFRTGGSEQT